MSIGPTEDSCQEWQSRNGVFTCKILMHWHSLSMPEIIRKNFSGTPRTSSEEQEYEFFPLAFSTRLRLGSCLGFVQFPDYTVILILFILLHSVNANLTADQIAGTDKECLCISKVLFTSPCSLPPVVLQAPVCCLSYCILFMHFALSVIVKSIILISSDIHMVLNLHVFLFLAVAPKVKVKTLVQCILILTRVLQKYY